MPNGHRGAVSLDTDSNNQSGLGDLEKLIGLMGKSGGIFGLSNPLSMGLLMGGSALFSGLSSLIGGKSSGEKRREEVFNLAKNRLNQPVADPEQYVSQFRAARAPEQARSAEQINRRLGLDVGVAQGELATGQMQELARFLLGARMRAAEMKSQKENFLLSLMGQLGGGRG